MGLFDDIEKAKKKQRGGGSLDFQPAQTEAEKNAKAKPALAGKKAKYLVELRYMHPVFNQSGGVGFKNVFTVIECLEKSEGVTPNDNGSTATTYLGPKSFSFKSDMKNMFEALVPEEAVDRAGVEGCYGVQAEPRSQALYAAVRFEPTHSIKEKEAILSARYVDEKGQPLPISEHPLKGRRAILEVYLKDSGFQDFTFSPAPAP